MLIESWSSPGFFSGTTQPTECQCNSLTLISFCSKTSSWILNFNSLFPLKAMTLVTLLGKTLHAHRNKRKKKKKEENLKIALGFQWKHFSLSNKLAARVVSKIVLIGFVLWSVPNILETSSHFLNLCNSQSSIWLYVSKHLRPSITYTWKVPLLEEWRFTSNVSD